MALNVSKEMTSKLATVGDAPILDSSFGTNNDGSHFEKTIGQQGLYISSEADGWTLRGPFPVAL